MFFDKYKMGIVLFGYQLRPGGHFSLSGAQMLQKIFFLHLSSLTGFSDFVLEFLKIEQGLLLFETLQPALCR